MAAPDFGSLTDLSNASAVIYGLTQTSLGNYGQLTAARQALVFVDLGNANSSPAQVGLRFGALSSARLSIQIVVNAANAVNGEGMLADITAEDFLTEGEFVGRMVAVRNGIAGVEAQGLYLNGDPAANTAAADAAINGFNAMNTFGQAVILSAINAGGFTSFTELAAASNAAYPAAQFANINGAANAAEMLAAFGVSGFTTDTTYAGLASARQSLTSQDMFRKRPSGAGFASNDAALAEFNKSVAVYSAVQTVVDSANAGTYSVEKISALYVALVANGGMASGEPNTAGLQASDVAFSVAITSSLNTAGMTALNAAYMAAPDFGSLTDLSNASAVIYGLTQTSLGNYGQLTAARQALVFADLGNANSSPAQVGLRFGALSSARLSIQIVVNAANAVAGEGLLADISAADYSTDGRMVAVRDGIAAVEELGLSVSSEPTSADITVDINNFNAMNTFGQAVILSAINAGGFTTFTAVANATDLVYPTAQLANINGAENATEMLAAFGVSGFTADTTYAGLVASRKELTSQDMFRKRPVAAGFASNDAALAEFNKSVAVYSAVQTVVDGANAGTYSVTKISALYAALVANGGMASGDPNTAGLQATDVAFSVAISSSLNTAGMTALNAAYMAAPDFGSLTDLSNASAVIYGITPTMLSNYGALIAERQALVFTDLGTDNSSPSQSGARFGALSSARLSIQVAVNAGNANQLVAADFSTGGRIVAVRNGVNAVESLGLFLNGDPAANTAAMDAAIASFNVLNNGGRGVILAAMNVTEGETAFTSFTAMSLAAQTAYPTAVLVNLNSADSTNIVSALTVAAILPDAGYDALSETRQGQVQSDILGNRPQLGYASVADADALFGKLVTFRATSGAVVDAGNSVEGTSDIVAGDFSGTGRIVAVRDAKNALGMSSLVGETITLAAIDSFMSQFDALSTAGENVILGTINAGGHASFTALVNTASAQFPRAVGRDLIAAGITSGNSVEEIAQAVEFAEDNEIAVDATGMDNELLNAVAAGAVKVNSITGTMALNKDLTAATLGILLGEAAAGTGSTVNVDATGMSPAQLDVLTEAANIGKVDSITGLVLASTETDAQITALLGKVADLGATAVATNMNVAQLNALSGAIGKIAADSITGTMMVTSEVSGLGALLDATAGATASVQVNAAGFEFTGKDTLVSKSSKVDSIWNLSLASTEDDAQIGTLLSLSIAAAVEAGEGVEAKAMAVATATDMNQLQLGALGAGALKIGASGITGTLVIDSTVANLGALLGKTSTEASVGVDAANFDADGKGVLASNASKVDTITNLALAVSETSAEIDLLVGKCANGTITVNASGMDADQKGSIAAAILKVSSISNLSLASSETAGEITALLGKASDGAVLVNASGMAFGQLNALGAAIVKIAADGITGTFTIDSGVTYIAAVLGKTSASLATVTVDANNMSASQLNDVGNNVEKVDTLLNVTIVADASLTIEALTDLMANITDVIVNATNMTPAQLDVVADYAANIVANGVRGTMVLNKDVDATTLSALLGKTSADQGTVNANATLMSATHLSALSSNISKVDTITSLTLTSAQAAGEITNLLTKTTGALAVATDMDAAKLNALAATASIANIAADGISGNMLLTSDVSDANISSLMTKTPASASVRVNGMGMVAATQQLLVTLDSKIDTVYNMALTSTLSNAELSNLLGKSDAASATVNATGMGSETTGKLSVIAANISKVSAGGISGSLVIDSRLASADIGAVLGKISTASSFIGTTVAIDANGMSANQLSSIATAVNALSSATASGIYSMDNLTLTSAQGSSVISGLILITNPGEASVVATGMDAAQLSGLGVYGSAIGSITGTVNITSGVSAAAITAIMNTSVASGAFVNVDPTGFGTDQLNAYNGVLTSQALMIVTAELTGSTGQSFVKANENVVIRVEAKNLSANAVGAQGRVNYDATKLTFVSIRSGNQVSAGNFMPTLFPGSVAGSANGVSYVTFYTGVDFSDNTAIGAQSGIVAELVFQTTSAGFCKESALASLNQSFVNRLVTAASPNSAPLTISVIPSAAMEVSALKDLTLASVPAADSADDIFYYADAGFVTGTIVTNPGVTASNNCAASVPVSISITYPDSSTGTTWPTRFPVGTSRVTWTTTDEANNIATSYRDIVIRDKQLVTVDVNLDGIVNAGLSYTQDIRFRLSSGDVVNATVSFAGSNGTVRDVEIPVRNDYTCISVKDGDHTVADAQTMPVVGTKYVPSASFSLIGGDSNDDNVVDILDFGVFVADRSVLGSAPKTADSRSNFNHDIVVGNSDFTFISNNFLVSGDTCGGGFANGDGPIARISVKELRRRGLGELAQADINGDGWVDQFDIALAAQGRFSKDAQPQADDAEGMENPNW
jgi:hypothetical protein